MNFIKMLFEDKPDEDCHRQFKRYGKGFYENKAVLDISVGKKDVKIKSTFEYAHEFIKILAETIDEKTKVTGVIITTKDISKELSFNPVGMSQFAGVKSIKIDNELSKKDILDNIHAHPECLFLLSFTTSAGSLKIKPKSPRSGKPPKKENEEVKADFCSLKITNKDILQDYAFDIKQEFKKAFIKHTFDISSVEAPEEYKNDFAKIREFGKRKGTITRESNIDGKTSISKHDFLA